MIEREAAGFEVAYDLSPAVAIFADTADARRSAQAVVSAIGARAGMIARIDDAIPMLDEAVYFDAVLVEIEGDGGALLEALLERLDQAAGEDRYPSVVAFAPDLIDVVAARARHPNVALLVGEPWEACAAALGVALATRRQSDPLIAENEREPIQLLQLSEEVSRIARVLASLSESADKASLPPRSDDVAEPPTAATVRSAIRARRLREQFFDARLFADPAWDMILDLMAARLEGRPVAVSSLCIAAAVPPTTALRWMKQLTDEGLLVRVADPRDGRRVFIELSDEAAAATSAYFQALARSGVRMP